MYPISCVPGSPHHGVPEAKDTRESFSYTLGKAETKCWEWQKSGIRKASLICSACLGWHLDPSDPLLPTLNAVPTGHICMTCCRKRFQIQDLDIISGKGGSVQAGRHPSKRSYLWLPEAVVKKKQNKKRSQKVQLHWKQPPKRKTKGSSRLSGAFHTKSFCKVISLQKKVLVCILPLETAQCCNHGCRLRNRSSS